MGAAFSHVEILKQVQGLGLLDNAEILLRDGANDPYILQGRATVGGQTLALRLVLDLNFPHCLPEIRLLPQDNLGIIPHVVNGIVCFQEADGFVLDSREPLHLIQTSLTEALRVLSEGLADPNHLANHMEIASEFGAYWLMLPGITLADSLFEPPDIVCDILLYDKASIICQTPQDRDDFNNGGTSSRYLFAERGIYIPLEPSAIVVPPLPQEPFWTMVDVRRILTPLISDENKRRLENLYRPVKAPDQERLFCIWVTSSIRSPNPLWYRCN